MRLEKPTGNIKSLQPADKPSLNSYLRFLAKKGFKTPKGFLSHKNIFYWL